MFEIALIYLLLGAFAGIVAGLLGVGGGLIIVPVLVAVFKLQSFDPQIVMQLALGTSLATIVFTALSSVIAHHRRGAVVWGMVGKMAPGMLLGAMIGAYIADIASGEHLKLFFAVFEVAVAVYLFMGAPVATNVFPATLKWTESLAASTSIGAISSLLGIGGGTLNVPYLCMRGTNIRQAIAVSAACGIPIAVSGALGYCLLGLDEAYLPAYSSGFIYWPALAGIVTASLITAPLGAALAQRLPVAILRKIFSVVLVVMAAIMIFI